MTTKPNFEIGQRVRITMQDSMLRGEEATIYWYEPGRPCPWHVRPDGWGDVPGVAFKADELERVEENDTTG